MAGVAVLSWTAVGTVVLGRLGPGLAFFFILGARRAMTKASTTEITAMAIAATVLSIICGGGGGGGGGADHGNRMSMWAQTKGALCCSLTRG
jgi:hypothetical protein